MKPAVRLGETGNTREEAMAEPKKKRGGVKQRVANEEEKGHGARA